MNELSTDVQQALFDTPADGPGIGYRAPTVCNATGVTYRQLDYWTRTGLIEPSLKTAQGSGSQRLYSFHDLLTVKVIRKLLEAGVSLQQVRLAITHLRSLPDEQLSTVTLISDGSSVYAHTDSDQIMDLLAGGQGVFAIAVGAVAGDVNATIRAIPGVTMTGDVAVEESVDDLSARRALRAAG